MISKLSNTTKRELKTSSALKGMLADLFDKHVVSIERWIEEDNPMLTAYDAVLLYQQQLGLTVEQIFEPKNIASHVG